MASYVEIPPPVQPAPPDAGNGRRNTTGGRDPHVATLMNDLVEELVRLGTDEVALLRLTGRRRAKRVGIGSGLLVAAGLFGFTAYCCGVAAAVLALDGVMRPWAAAITVAVLAVFAAGLVAVPALLLLLRKREAFVAEAVGRIREDVRAFTSAYHRG